MSLEDDILKSQQEMIEGSKESVAFIGTVQNVDPIMVTLDGSSVAIPAICLDDVNLAAGKRVVVGRYGAYYVILGALGNRVVNFPSYDGADPTGTSDGDAWYRSDLTQAFMTVAGVATPLGGGGSNLVIATTADVNYGTTLTVITQLGLVLEPGIWTLRGNFPWDYVGTTDNFFAIGFTGSVAGYGFNANRNVGTANAYMPDLAFAAEENMGQTHNQAVDLSGTIEVTVEGTFQIAFRRAAGTSGTVKAGASLLAFKV